jgi:hypothetical protein
MNLKRHQQVEADILAALAKVGKKHNVTFGTKGGTYSTSGTAVDVFRITAIENSASGQPRDIAREAFLDYIKQWDTPNTVGYLKKEWLDKTFRGGKHDYTIVGYAPSKKNCIVTKRDDGETYFWSVAAIEQHMKVAVQPAVQAA